MLFVCDDNYLAEAKLAHRGKARLISVLGTDLQSGVTVTFVELQVSGLARGGVEYLNGCG